MHDLLTRGFTPNATYFEAERREPSGLHTNKKRLTLNPEGLNFSPIKLSNRATIATMWSRCETDEDRACTALALVDPGQRKKVGPSAGMLGLVVRKAISFYYMKSKATKESSVKVEK